MSDPILAVLIDDHPLFRKGVAHTLRTEPDIQVVGEGATAGEALRLCQGFLADILLLDISIAGGGLKAARDVAAACPFTKIVMLTVSEAEDDVTAALKAEARLRLEGGPRGS
jgi:DNA-binding NarL/FixJ family response regulator